MPKTPPEIPAIHAATQPPLLRDGSFRSSLVGKLPSFLLVTFVTITVLAVFVPLNPDMPQTGLDQSWRFATNEAVARHLRFGKEFIFTFGPYASIHTRSFHPATDRLMVLGSFLLGIAYLISLLYLARGQKPRIIIILTLFFATFHSPDALLESYPFMLVVCALKFVDPKEILHKAQLSWQQVLAIAVTFSALGLLPLIKGSLLFMSGVSTVFLGFFLLHRFPFRQSIPLLLVPFTSAVLFWILAGQSLSDIPAFLHGNMHLISGYTEAMSSPWLIWPPAIGNGFMLAYAAALALLAWSIFHTGRLNVRSKWVLGFLCAAFLSFAFKHGFVRSYGVSIAFDSFFISTLIICFLYTDRFIVGSLILVFPLIMGIYIRQDPELLTEVRQAFGVGSFVGTGTFVGTGHLKEVVTFISRRLLATCARITYESTWNTYSSAGRGLRSRLTQSTSLHDRFAGALADIRSEYSVPPLQGTADVYTVEQSVLLASGNHWNPRPVIQSYAAYTPALATVNAEHLRTANAPDWVLLNLMSIDERLPSLDDGLSWPALLENYTFVSFDGRFVLLRKNSPIATSDNLQVIYKETHEIGRTVALPETEGPLFAEVDLKPTLLGKALIALFKPPQLNMVLNLKNGSTRTYRVVSNMMVTGFIVSPLVSNTSDFASLAAGNPRFQKEGTVASISITPSYGGSIFWSGTYVLTLKTHGGPSHGSS